MSTATTADAPQLYLITPVGATADALEPLLAEVLDRVPVACLRLRAGDDPDELSRLADRLRVLAHERDVPIVVEDHVQLALQHGLDGVHLTDGARNVRAARRDLGPDAIVGAFCGASRHEGIGAGEAGADYVAFGPVGSGALLRGEPVAFELFEWWSEVIEVPVVAEGGLDAALIAALSPMADFIALGTEIWSAPDPAATLAALWR